MVPDHPAVAARAQLNSLKVHSLLSKSLSCLLSF
uniref:Uncharacterized protein n=1 Tax=Anguilla anguilla TaxID=7936 RepID=A0A0E9PT28_ANGAN